MSKPTSKRPRLVFVVSDIHAGSTVAIMPPKFTTLEGVVLDQNPVQKFFWKCWTDAMKWVASVANGDPYVVVVNGDAIEGNHHRTTQIISADTGDHVECAIHILRDLVARANKTFMIRGTECHTQNAEVVLGKAMKTERNPESGLPAWDKLYMDVAGVRCIFRHHIGTSVRRGLAGTQLSLQLAEEQVEAANANLPIPRVLCCAHRHKFGYYHDNNGICLVSPPWQALTRHGHKVVGSAVTNPGLYALDFRDCREGELPRVHSKVYECEQPQAIAI